MLRKLFFVASLVFFISISYLLPSAYTQAPVVIPKIEKMITAPVVKASTVGLPAQLQIPKLNINVAIEHIGLTAKGAVGVPESAQSVSWFSAGTVPGSNGSAVISGHSGIWKDGSHSIFDPLPTLKPNDIIYVTDDQGTKRTFVVQEIKVYGKDEIVPEIFNKNDGAYLNIITCHGTYLTQQKTYDKRLVVFAKAL